VAASTAKSQNQRPQGFDLWNAKFSSGGVMGKLKTRKVASSRIKISGTGKAMAWKAGKRHLSYHKSGDEIRGKGKAYVLAEADQERVLRMFPYGGK
jgi:large subunit ribosomal protein L35